MQEKKQELEKRLLDVNDRMGNANKKVPKKGKYVVRYLSIFKWTSIVYYSVFF